MTRITGLYRNKIYIFFIISRSILLKVKNILDKICIENQNKHLVFNIFFPLENRDVNEIMWKNIALRGRPLMTKWRMRIACWVPEATNSHRTVCNTHCFSTATMVAQTCLSVALYVHCLYCCCKFPLLLSAAISTR